MTFLKDPTRKIGSTKEIMTMMGFGFLMMFAVVILPIVGLVGIVFLVIWLMSRSKK